jgi:hypothetical protein
VGLEAVDLDVVIAKFRIIHSVPAEILDEKKLGLSRFKAIDRMVSISGFSRAAGILNHNWYFG